MSNKKISHVDLFAGAGGICTGFKAAGIKTVLAVEKVESCAETYKKNHPKVNFIHKDIRHVTKKDLQIINNLEIDIITSGMPCETFSTAGSTSRSFYDHRQQLYYETIRLSKILKPKIILFENVPGILSKKVVKGGKRLVIDDIFDDLSQIGYKHFIQTTLNACDFGTPQNRQRYFIIAANDMSLELTVPVSTHNGVTTVSKAFKGLPTIKANESKKNLKYTKSESEYSQLLKDKSFWKTGSGFEQVLTYHVAPNHRKGTIQRFKLIKQGENLKDVFTKRSEGEVKRLQEKRILPKKWFIQRNMRLFPNLPSKTVTSHCLDELVHPLLDRALTVREVARLQSFPDSYDFKGGPYICPHIYVTQDKYEQIGDAVPPLLAYHWGITLKKILKRK